MNPPRILSLLALLMCLGCVVTAGAQQPVAPTPPPTARELLQGGEAKAISIIVNASRSDRAQLRANALEAIMPRPKRALPMAQLALEDENPAVRFAALVTVGQLQLHSLGRKAQRMVSDEDASVRAAAVYAATRCGINVNMNELPLMLRHKDISVRANAVMLLGMMEDRTAVPMLREMVQQPIRRASPVRQAILRLQYAEAMTKLGEDTELEPIRAAMFSQEYEVRVLAVQMIGELEDQSMARALRNLLDDEPVELKLAAAQSLARMGDSSGKPAALAAAILDAPTIEAQARAFVKKNPRSEFAPVYRALLADPERQQRVAALARGQSAFALAEMDGADAAAALVGLLNDEEPIVRLSAAAGILKAAR